MANHIDYDREENKIELILDSQRNVISTLLSVSYCNSLWDYATYNYNTSGSVGPS